MPSSSLALGPPEQLGESSRHAELTTPHSAPAHMPGPLSPALGHASSSGMRTTGSWQPLPYIYSGFAIYPYRPSGRSSTSPRSVNSSKVGEAPPSASRSPRSRKYSHKSSTPKRKHQHDEPATPLVKPRNVHEVALNVGDEFFAFEEYRCSVEEDGRGDVWYRGYVLQSTPLRKLAPAPSAASSSTHRYTTPHSEPTVLLGIFPAAVVHIRTDDDGAGADAQLAEAYMRALHLAEEKAAEAKRQVLSSGEVGSVVVDFDRLQGREGVRGDSDQPGGVGLGLRGAEVSASRKAENRKSLRVPELLSRSDRALSQDMRRRGSALETDKEQPPIPTLMAGDSTLAGAKYPLVDEIACAVRDWYARLPTYLANREYRLFGTIMQHIDALLLGRRQLLAQVLSADEMKRVTRECVSRLVKCNVAQSLEVVVRSLQDGSVMVLDKERAMSESSWMTGIQAYVHQIQLAYIDLLPFDAIASPRSLLSPAPPSATSLKTSRSSAALRPDRGTSIDPKGLFHCLLDVRAFIASPCSPGETAELYFSLYNKQTKRFLTEEYCLVLNHLGSPARDAEQRLGQLHAIFTDLKVDEVSSPLCLVCKIVRNGSLRMKADHAGSTLSTIKQRGGAAICQPGLATVDEMGVLRGASTADVISLDSMSITSGRAAVGRFNSVATTMTNMTATTLNGRPAFRRPLGCAVIEVANLTRFLVDDPEGSQPGSEFTMPIYVSKEEGSFAKLHEDILAGRTHAYSKSSRLGSVVVDLKLFQGNANQIVGEHPALLSDVPVCSRLGFADVAFPGDERNDIYIQLGSGSFSSALNSISTGTTRLRRSLSAAASGNIQVTLEVRHADGSVIPGCLHAGGAGELPLTQYHSMVFVGNDRPAFGENVKLSLPPEIADCHLFFAFRSRGSKTATTEYGELETPFAHAFIPLLADGVVLQDGPHDLALYRMDAAAEYSSQVYMKAQWASSGGSNPPAGAPAMKGMIPMRDRLSIRTLLCSTVRSQDTAVRQILHHRQMSSIAVDTAVLEAALTRFTFVTEDEIAKFVPSLLDALLSIITFAQQSNSPTLQALALQGIVKVLSLSADRRFGHFDGVLDAYLADHFDQTSATSALFVAIRDSAKAPASKDFRVLLKVLHLLMRIVTRARNLLAEEAAAVDTETSLRLAKEYDGLADRVRDVLEELGSILLNNDDKTLIGTQTLIVQHFPDLIPYLIDLFGHEQIVQILVRSVNSIPDTNAALSTYKLLLILHIVRTTFESARIRALLVPALLHWVRPHLRSHDATRAPGNDPLSNSKRVKWLENCRLAVTVVAFVVDNLERRVAEAPHHEDAQAHSQDEDNLWRCLALLPFLSAAFTDVSSPVNADAIRRVRASSPGIWSASPDVFPRSYPFALLCDLPPPSHMASEQLASEDGLVTSETFAGGVAETAVVTISLLLAALKSSLLRYFTDLIESEGSDACSAVLISLFDFGQTIIRSGAFPSQWVTLSMMGYQSMIKLFDVAADILSREGFVPGSGELEDDFDQLLWQKCLRTLCETLGSSDLALEDLSPQRRRATWIIAGDLREAGSGILQRLLGIVEARPERLAAFYPCLAGLTERVVSLCLTSHDHLRAAAAQMLFVIARAADERGDLSTVEADIFLTLETVELKYPATPGDSPHALFVSQLRAIATTRLAPEDAFMDRFSVLLEDLQRFVDLLRVSQEVPATPEWKDERASAVVELVQFAKATDRPDMYARFTRQLSRIMVDSKDWLGAGYALKLEADSHPWTLDGVVVGPVEDGTIRLPEQTPFARRESLYYHAIDHFAEAEAYESALALCQELIAQHQSLTLDAHKLSELSSYQAKLWDKIGQAPRHTPEYFRVAYYGDFTSVNREKEFVVRGQPWQRYHDFCEGLRAKHPDAKLYKSKIPPTPSSPIVKLIWVTPVQPEPAVDHPALHSASQANVVEYYKRHGVSTFSTTRPITVDGTSPKPDAQGHLSWLEKMVLTTAEELPGLVSRSEIVQRAWRQVSPVQAALDEVERATHDLEAMTKRRPGIPIDVKQLGTAINGAVDSPVNGGIKLYRTTFLESDYLVQHPREAPTGQRLQAAILAYVETVRDALSVHKSLCTDQMYHEALRSRFYKAFPEEIAELPRMSMSTVGSLRIPDFPSPPPAPPTPSLNDHPTSFHQLVIQSREHKVSIVSQTPSRPSITVSTSDLGEGHVPPALPVGPVVSSSPLGQSSVSLGPAGALNVDPGLGRPRPLSRGSSIRSVGGASLQRAVSFAGSLGRRSSRQHGGGGGGGTTISGGGGASNRNSMASINTTLSALSIKRDTAHSIRSVASANGQGSRSAAPEGREPRKSGGLKRISRLLKKAYGEA